LGAAARGLLALRRRRKAAAHDRCIGEDDEDVLLVRHPFDPIPVRDLFARRRGYARVSLETGSQDFFAPARRLYERHGFVECGPFGDYVLDPHSVFFTREL